MENKRINPAWLDAIAQILTAVFKDGKKADKAIEKIFMANKKYGRQDRAFIAENSYEIIRYWRLLHFLLERDPDFSKQGLWEIFGVYHLSQGGTLPKWKEFDKLKKSYLSRWKDAEKNDEIFQSYGADLYQRASEQLGDRWPAIAKALNKPAKLVLRANSLKNDRESLKKLLEKEGIYTEELSGIPFALVCKERKNLFQSPLFKEGRFEVQDAGSQKIAEFCKAEPGQFVIDACAGAGGKTLYLGAAMKNKGRIISMDVEAYKLQELKKRAARAGLSLVQTQCIESTKNIKKYADRADIVLLDAPCSGSGVIKRNPDAKYRITHDYIDGLKKIQENILTQYASMVKEKGYLVYATCSILPEENEEQVRKFLDTHPEFSLTEEVSLLPSEYDYDGFYMAKMVKK